MEEPIRILCVDHEKNILKSLKRLFLDDDYEVLAASSGDEGIDKLQKISPIQIVISDYRMPGMNGINFLQDVYKKWPETIRIALSGYADIATIIDAINEGHIYKFIPKPWNDQELKISISHSLDHYFLLKKNFQLTKELQQVNEKLIITNMNLEALVEDRTSELIFQNHVLMRSQKILDALPVAVLGADFEGTVVQSNQMVRDILKTEPGEVIGTNINDFLPQDISDFFKNIEKDFLHTTSKMNGNYLSIKRGVIKHQGNLEGFVFVFDNEGRYG